MYPHQREIDCIYIRRVHRIKPTISKTQFKMILKFHSFEDEPNDSVGLGNLGNLGKSK